MQNNRRNRLYSSLSTIADFSIYVTSYLDKSVLGAKNFLIIKAVKPEVLLCQFRTPELILKSLLNPLS